MHGSATQPGVGLPAPITDEESFRLDFTPYIKRTIQRQGAELEGIHYYAPILRRWVGEKDPNTGKARKFIFARDPRDISVVYFLDPDTQVYSPIPYFNTTRPAVSLWELRAATKALNQDPASRVDEEMIFKGIRRMREIEEAAVEKTRLAKQQRGVEKRKRRMVERRNGWVGVHQAEMPEPVDAPSTDGLEDDIQPFTDIQLS